MAPLSVAQSAQVRLRPWRPSGLVLDLEELRSQLVRPLPVLRRAQPRSANDEAWPYKRSLIRAQEQLRQVTCRQAILSGRQLSVLFLSVIVEGADSVAAVMQQRERAGPGHAEATRPQRVWRIGSGHVPDRGSRKDGVIADYEVE